MQKLPSSFFYGMLTLGMAYSAWKIISNRDPPNIIEQRPINITDLIQLYSNEFSDSKIMEQIIPRVFENQKHLQRLTTNLYYRQQNSHLESLSKALSQPIWDLLDRGGKRWRPILCMLIAQMYGRNRKQVYDIAALCEIIHNGTLIIDDIQDNSLQRRSKDCVHLIYGIDISVNAGNFMYFAPLLYLLKSRNFSEQKLVQIGRIYAQEMTNLHIGQGWDILWHNIKKLNGNYPNQNDYLQMTAHKTGVLARLSARLVCVYLCLPQKQAKVLARFAETMGVAFQIQDDLLNLEGGKVASSKGLIGEDIHEGKVTLMVIHFLSSESSNKKKERLIEILTKKTQDKEQINEAIQMMKNTGSLEYAKKKMNNLIDAIWLEVQQTLPNNIFRHYIRQLAFFSIRRQV